MATEQTTNIPVPPVNVFKEADLILLLSENYVPEWWDCCSNVVTYDIVNKLFECCYKVSGSYETLMRNALPFFVDV